MYLYTADGFATLTSVSRSALRTSEEAVTPEGTPKTGLLVILGIFKASSSFHLLT